MIRAIRKFFAWRTTYENHAWWRMTNGITGEHRWLRKGGSGYSPIPMLEDECGPPPLGKPPMGGSAVQRPTR